MWQLDEQQAARIAKTAAGIDRLCEELGLADKGKLSGWAEQDEPRYSFQLWEPVVMLLPALQRLLGDETERNLSEFLCYPACRTVSKGDLKGLHLLRISESAAAVWLVHHKSKVASDMLSARLRAMLSDPIAGSEGAFDNWRVVRLPGYEPPEVGFFFPRTWDCLSLLAQLPATQSQLQLIGEIFEGKWPDALSKDIDTQTGIFRFNHLTRTHWAWLAMHLLENGLLDEDGYRRAIPVVGPMLLHVASCSGDAQKEYELGQASRASIDHALSTGNYAGTWRQKCGIAGFDFNSFDYNECSPPHAPKTVETLKDWAFREVQRHLDGMGLADKPQWLVGGAHRCRDIRWPLTALRQMERLALDRKIFMKEVRGYGLINELGEMLSLKIYGAGQSEETLLTGLSAFRPETLEMALPHAGEAKPVFLRALGWHDTLPLYAALREHAWEPDPEAAGADDEESTTPRLDREALLAALKQVKQEHRKRFAEAMATKAADKFSRHPCDRPLRPYFMAVEALEGNNRDEIDKAIAKGAYFAIRAYGLLPVPDDAELLLRYRRLSQMLKDSAQFGQERRANTRKTVAVAMDYLAQGAGYADGMRLEWSMEARFADELRAAGAPRQVQQWTLALDFDSSSPQITVHKEGKPLASVPPALRKTEPYLELKARLDHHRTQMRRFKKLLEAGMAEGEAWPFDQLKLLRSLPYGNALLQTLVLRSEEGALGLLHPTQDALIDLEDHQHPIGETFRIAHVYDLFKAGQLSAWQRRIVAQQWVQPFKQVFRELYILTPAEIASGDQSLRFANHQVDARKAARLLQSRNWLTARDDYGVCTKTDQASGLSACFIFEGIYGFMGGDSGYLTSGAIRFTRKIPKHGQPSEFVALKDVPPILLSETFRDADLTVSVAQVIDDDDEFDELFEFGELIVAEEEDSLYCSGETVTHRTTLVAAMVQKLGIEGVRCEGRFAYVQGRRANYRVHLASAAIHILPGNYLCIVSDKTSAKKDELYLPFEETDTRMREILSKIFLLLRDDHIQDKDITQQIDTAVAFTSTV